MGDSCWSPSEPITSWWTRLVASKYRTRGEAMLNHGDAMAAEGLTHMGAEPPDTLRTDLLRIVLMRHGMNIVNFRKTLKAHLWDHHLTPILTPQFNGYDRWVPNVVKHPVSYTSNDAAILRQKPAPEPRYSGQIFSSTTPRYLKVASFYSSFQRFSSARRNQAGLVADHQQGNEYLSDWNRNGMFNAT